MSCGNWIVAYPERARKRLSMVFLGAVLLWTPIMLAQSGAQERMRRDIDRLEERMGAAEAAVAALQATADLTLEMVKGFDGKLWALILLVLVTLAGLVQLNRKRK